MPKDHGPPPDDPAFAGAPSGSPIRTAWTPEDPGLIDLLDMIWRGRLVVAFSALVALVLAGAHLWFFGAPLYRATVELALDPIDSQEDPIPGLAIREIDPGLVASEVRVIRSRILLRRLVDALDLTGDAEFAARPDPWGWVRAMVGADPPEPREVTGDRRDPVVDRLRRVVLASGEGVSRVFVLAVTSHDPAKAARIANLLAEIYLDDQIARKEEAITAAITWLADRVAGLEGEIAQAEGRIAAIRDGAALAGDAGVAALDAQIIALRARQDAALRLQEQVAARLAEIDGLEGSRLAGSPQELAAFLADPQLLALAFDAGQGQMTDAFAARLVRLGLQLRGELLEQQVLVADLVREAADLAERKRIQNDALAGIAAEERALQSVRLLHETYLIRLRELSLALNRQSADARIISPATPGEQVAPDWPGTLTLAAVLGLGAGVAVVLVRGSRNRTFRTAAELEDFAGLPVLGLIPRGALRAARADGPETGASGVDGPAFGQALRGLRIALSRGDAAPGVILVTSSLPGEGKSTLALAFARNLSRLGRRVLLIEGDLRGGGAFALPQQILPNHALPNHALPERSGLISLIAGTCPPDRAIHREQDSGLAILSAEAGAADAADLFGSEAFLRSLTALRRDYDHLVIDTPPVLAAPDAELIAPLADAVLYLVDWDRTTGRQLAEGLRRFDIAGLAVDGLVLNRIEVRHRGRYAQAPRRNPA